MFRTSGPAIAAVELLSHSGARKRTGSLSQPVSPGSMNKAPPEYRLAVSGGPIWIPGKAGTTADEPGVEDAQAGTLRRGRGLRPPAPGSVKRPADQPATRLPGLLPPGTAGDSRGRGRRGMSLREAVSLREG